MASNLKLGERVCVKELHPTQVKDLFMVRYLGEKGAVVLLLPPEWHFARMFRVQFDNPNLEPLAFLGKELERV